MRREARNHLFLKSRGNIAKTTFVLLAVAGLTLLNDRRAFGDEPVDEGHTPRRAARLARRNQKPALKESGDAQEPAESASEGARAAAIDPVVELREEMKRLKAEIDRLKRQSPGRASERPLSSTAESATIFEPLEGASGLGENDDDPAVFGPPGIQLDGEPAPVEGPFGEIRLVQTQDEEPPPSELGAVPGQHIRPRRTDTLGSIGFPRARPYKPDLAHKKREIEAEFAEGINVRTNDDYFSLTFHNLTQADFRGFYPAGDPLHDGFIIPRQRWYVLGNISPYVRYYTVINRGYGSLDILDSWTDWGIGEIDRDKLQIRIGRMKTPYTYEYIKVAENDLIAAERSVFVGNLAPNREIGAMVHGQIYNKRLEYALGVFNGPRRSFQDFNSGEDLFVFTNTKPFLEGDNEVLKQLNIGGSWNWGNQHNPVQPAALRTANDQSTSSAAENVSPTFFRFLPNVFESGTRMQWSGDIAYYYKSFGVLAGYQGGFQDYAIAGKPPSNVQELTLGTAAFVGVNGKGNTRVPMTGYSVALFYFLTGEEITRRRELLEPRKEYMGSKFLDGNIGAVELFSRFAFLSLGNEVFTADLADPAISTNRINVLDNGLNWYLNHYTKLTFDWQYCAYGGQVWRTPTSTTSFTNLFWFRTQVFF